MNIDSRHWLWQCIIRLMRGRAARARAACRVCVSVLPCCRGRPDRRIKLRTGLSVRSRGSRSCETCFRPCVLYVYFEVSC